ncbi:MAG: hypothetical protein K8R11_11140 [Methanococcoides sp.]|nr:hypothetical protein [Methanococcoides sp.]
MKKNDSLDEMVQTTIRLPRRDLVLLDGFLEWWNDRSSINLGRRHHDISRSDYLRHAIWSAIVEDYGEYAEFSGLTIEETMENVINNFLEELGGE